MNTQGAKEFEPSVEWVHEDDSDTLLLYLPGFLKEQLRVQLKSRTLIISGQRKLQDNTWTVFRKEFPVSQHCDLNKISAKFEGSILYVKQPKLATVVAKQEENRPMNTPTPMQEKPKDSQPQVQPMQKPDSQLTSSTQPNGKQDVDANAKDVSKKDEEKDGGQDGEFKEPIGVGENASTKKGSGSGLVMDLKPSKNDIIKVLVVVVGIVVAVYGTKLIKSWIG